ncbi:hypothetical protein Q4610_02140 [Sphingobium sp. HBC34]|uniref:Outer membrane protein beta-barrel domain-containing protein n=1 Tax=Sphingobium cyanobacteriorum TaxID=3063954 RepID=A0ABT8ZH09_9SPHN|nr:hypothetical protein [Sphingobium sp. HBC34]MDO7833834.1 hypothetical protein [Sphingobium sp. HBC34]
MAYFRYWGATAAFICVGALPAQVAARDAAPSDPGSLPVTQQKAGTISSSLRLSTGLNFSTGDYGDTQDTKVYSAPVAVTYKRGGLKLRVSVPWVRVEGPASLLQTPEGRDKTNNGAQSGGSGGASGSNGGGSSGSDIEVEDEDDGAVIDDKGGLGNSGSGGGGSDDNGSDDDDDGDGAGTGGTGGGTTPVGTIASAMQRRSGFGDVNVAATYSFDLGGDFYFEPTARVKLPTASRRKRLGTKKVDVTIAADLVKDIGKFSFYLHGRRKFAGKPDGSTIRSTWGAGGGFSLSAAKGISLGADYDWQQSTFAGRTPSSEVTGWTSIRLSPRWNMTAYGLVGTNQNSARYGAGLSISYRLF